MATFTVLGASGFVGGHLTRHLRERGHEVATPGRDDSTVFDRPLGRVIYSIGLTTDYGTRPLDTAEAHVERLLRILREARFDRLVYLSSVRLYDGLPGTVEETAMLRLDPRNPRHLYDFSKALGEALALHGGRPATVARLAGVYDNKLSQADFLCNTVRQALAGGRVEIDSTPDLGRDYIHVDDVSTALEAIALDPREPIYNVASGVVFTNRELASVCEAELAAELVFDGDSTSGVVPLVSIARLERDFGIRPEPPARRLSGILRQLRANLADTG